MKIVTERRLYWAVLSISVCLACSFLAHSAVLYVDNTLPGDCTGSYSIANRSCTGADGDAYDTLKRAADATSPGDLVSIRGGNYYDVISNCANSGYCYLLFINNSGTDGNPIIYQNYNNEKVALIGFGYEDQDLNGDGDADGPFRIERISVERENLVVINADYVHVKGLEIANAAHTGLSIRGSHNHVENNLVRDTFYSGITVGYNTTEDKIAEYNVVTGNEMRNNRYGSGVILGRTSSGTLDSYLNYTRFNTIENNLIHNNGYLPNGTKVKPFGVYNWGGGNSDGVGASKICADAATPTASNWCPNNTLRDNVVYHNADDGFDVSFVDSVIQGNISFDNGPEGNWGYKCLRYLPSLSFWGNVGMTNHVGGFVLRVEAGSSFSVYHNAALRNVGDGVSSVIYNVPKPHSNINNNVMLLNGGADLRIATCLDCGNNWLGGRDGDPQLVNASFTVNTNLPDGVSIAERRDFVRNQFIAALTPQADSPLVDAGRLIPGYHCATAGLHPEDTCREWYGEAPDIGVYELVAAGPFISLTAGPTAIVAGETVTLTWDTGVVTTCQGTGFDTAGAISGSTSVSPQTDTIYTLTCTGANGTVSDTATVTVTTPAPPAPRRG